MLDEGVVEARSTVLFTGMTICSSQNCCVILQTLAANISLIGFFQV